MSNRTAAKRPHMRQRIKTGISAYLICLLISATTPTLAHEDHSSRYGGFVMMFMDLHFELVLPAEGGVMLYYSDSIRVPMPAAVVSDVAVEIERPDGGYESVFMQIDETGESWQGDSQPVLDPDTIVRVAFLHRGEPFVLDIPASVYTNLGVPGHEQPAEPMQMEEMEMPQHQVLLDLPPDTRRPCQAHCAG